MEENKIKASNSNNNIATSHSWYLGDGREADGPEYQHFFQYRGTCEERHFTYPLLYSENLCNVSESLKPGIDVWVGIYRQKLFLKDSDKIGKKLCVSQFLRIQDCTVI